MEKSFFEKLLDELARVFNVVVDDIGNPVDNPAKFYDFLKSLGWDIPSTINLGNALPSIFQIATEIQGLVAGDSIDMDSVETLVEGFGSIDDMFDDLNLGLPATFSEFADKFPIQVGDFIIIKHLEYNHHTIFYVLKLLGVIREDFFIPTAENDPNNVRTRHIQRKVQWDIFQAYDSFSDLLTELFGWRQNIEYEQIFSTLRYLLASIGFASYFTFNEEIDLDDSFRLGSRYYRIPIFDDVITLAIDLIPVLHNADQAANGIALSLYLAGDFGKEINLADKFFLEIKSSMELQGALGFYLAPDRGFSVFNNVGDEIEGDLSFALKYVPDGPLLGDGAKGTRFVVEEFVLKLFFSYESSEPELGGQFNINNGALILQASEGDSFINKIMPSDPITIPFDFGIGYSMKKGLFFEGGVGLEFQFDVTKTLGPIFIDYFKLKAFYDFDTNQFSIEAAITAGLSLGPLQISVKEIGLKLNIDTQTPGLLGPADLGIGFKPPTGLGISLDAEVIKGGGFLDIDPPRYFGILQFSIAELFSATAIGLLTTELPNGQEGFSLLFSLTVQFGTPFELGMSFGLSGLGAIIGINRSLSEEGLRQAYYDNSLDMLMFPDDPIRDAPKILELMEVSFPATPDRFVFGAMADFVWGSEAELVTFSVGVALEIGGPLKIAILGTASSILPTKEAPILSLNFQVLGFLDTGNKTLAIDAGLFDSNLLQTFILTGGMALRSNWGDNPDFILSVGGFHPQFESPPNFPDLDRIGVIIGSGNPYAALKSYFAVTSNTVQTGASFELYGSWSGFTVDVGFGFDALVQFTPFYFDIHAFGWANLSGFGVSLLEARLDLYLQGPNPIVVAGTATVKVLFISADVSVRVTFGDEIEEPLEIVSPADKLHQQIYDLSTKYSIPRWVTMGVVASEIAEDRLLPMGSIIVSQSSVPLNLKMDRFGGGRPPADEKKLDITVEGNVSINSKPREYFAPAMLKNLSDTEKLSTPPYEYYEGGVELVGTSLLPGDNLTLSREIDYEVTIVREDDFEEVTTTEKMSSPFSLTLAFVTADDVRNLKRSWSVQGASTTLRPDRWNKEDDLGTAVKLNPETFTLSTNEHDGELFQRLVVDGEPVGDMTYFEARDLMEDLGIDGVTIRPTTLTTEA